MMAVGAYTSYFRKIFLKAQREKLLTNNNIYWQISS